MSYLSIKKIHLLSLPSLVDIKPSQLDTYLLANLSQFAQVIISPQQQILQMMLLSTLFSHMLTHLGKPQFFGVFISTLLSISIHWKNH